MTSTSPPAGGTGNIPPELGTVDEVATVLESGRRIPEPTPDATEPLDQLAHGLQCAHQLRMAVPDDLELQVAGLVHDIGHMLIPLDAANHAAEHGRVAGDAVRRLLGDRVARLVELHVPAKRYLVSTDPAYRSTLSTGSTRTLELQGGRMTVDELERFAGLSDRADAVRLRQADEVAKDPGRHVPGLDEWRPVLEAVADGARR
jgi:predicted HD phosphohydrolase